MTATKEATKDGALKPSEHITTETFKAEGSKPAESTAVAAFPTIATQGPSSTTRKSPPGSGNVTDPGSSIGVKQPPILARQPSKKVSRKQSAQDTRQEGGGGVPIHDVQTPPPTIGGNEHPNHKVTQAIGDRTTNESPLRPPLSADCMYLTPSRFAGLKSID